jgi:hypothetical protein
MCISVLLRRKNLTKELIMQFNAKESENALIDAVKEHCKECVHKSPEDILNSCQDKCETIQSVLENIFLMQKNMRLSEKQ